MYALSSSIIKSLFAITLFFAAITPSSILLRSFNESFNSLPAPGSTLLSPAANTVVIILNLASISSFIARLDVTAFISSLALSIPYIVGAN